MRLRGRCDEIDDPQGVVGPGVAPVGIDLPEDVAVVVERKERLLHLGQVVLDPLAGPRQFADAALSVALVALVHGVDGRRRVDESHGSSSCLDDVGPHDRQP